MNTEGDVHAIRKSKEPKGEKDHFKRNAKCKNPAKRDDKQQDNTFNCKYCGKSHASKQCPA